MATLKQIAANQQNAKKSTGPRTEEGKRRASQNAIKHGLHAHDFLLDIESEDSYHLFHDQLVHDYAPQTGTEFILIEQYVQAYFLKRRFLQKMPDLHLIESRHMSNETLISYPILMKMINQADRMLHRALEKLEAIKVERSKQEKQEALENVQESAPQSRITADTPKPLAEIGFVSSPFVTRDSEEPFSSLPFAESPLHSEKDAA